MGWFGKKKDDVIDLSEQYKRQQEKLAQEQAEPQQESQEKTPTFFQGLVNAAQKQNAEQQTEAQDLDYADLGEGIEERRRRLTKRLMEMTGKMEELSNQIYHLQQRVELLEKKLNVSGG